MCYKSPRKLTLIKALEITALVLILLVSVVGAAPFAYITNGDSNNISVIDTATNNVTATVNVGNSPEGVAVNPAGTKVYVTNWGSNTTSIIDTATYIVKTVNVGSNPYGIAVSSDGKKVYVANYGSNTTSIIDAATDTVKTVNVGEGPSGVVVTPDGKEVYVAGSRGFSVIDTVTNNVSLLSIPCSPLGAAFSSDGKKLYFTQPGSLASGLYMMYMTNYSVIQLGGGQDYGVTVSPDGKKVYATLGYDTYSNIVNHVDIIDTATNTGSSVRVGSFPRGVAITPDGTKVYVANSLSNTVSVIDTATNKIIATINVGNDPIAFGQFIVPAISAPTQTPILPVANFTSNVTSGYAPLTVQFKDISTGTPTSWKWNFGDGTNSTSRNTTHVYSRAGNYIVNLTASNANGTSSKLANITALNQTAKLLPVANFTSNVTGGFVPLSVQFNDSSLNATGWKWNFGDGNNSTAQNPPPHTFYLAKNYSVNLTASNANGTSYKVANITVQNPLPPVCNTSIIYGYSFNDSNKNKIMDPGEVGLSNLTISLNGYDTCNGTLVSITNKTNSTGYFIFNGIDPGVYVVSENFAIGWLPTSDTSYTPLTIPSNSTNIKRDFGNAKFAK